MKVIKLNKKNAVENLTARFKDLLTGISVHKLPGIYALIYDCLEDNGYIKNPEIEQEKNALYFAQKFVENEEYKKLYK